MYAGTEHINFPSYVYIKFARRLSKIVPYVYTNNSVEPIVKQSTNNKSSIILELEYENNKLIGHNCIPIYAGENKMELGGLDIKRSLETYSLKFGLNEQDYNTMRNELLHSLIEK